MYDFIFYDSFKETKCSDGRQIGDCYRLEFRKVVTSKDFQREFILGDGKVLS